MEKIKIDSIKNILKQDNSIIVVYLFGSQIKGKSSKYSDIDIAILFDDKVKKEEYTDKQIAIINNLSSILSKEIDVIVLNQTSLFLKYHILKEGIRIYEKPDRGQHDFEAKAIVEYLDFLPIKNRIENGLLTKIKEA